MDDLAPHYIWTKAYAQSRLHWKPMLPLAIMLVRVYRMEQPVTVPYYKEYSGCTSWVEILDHVSLGKLEPVLSDERFPAADRRDQGQPGAGGGGWLIPKVLPKIAGFS